MTLQTIKTRLKVRQMLLLLALDDCGNLSDAAEVTHMSQPAASKMLKEIEEIFGVPFFERFARGMRPTLYGSTMVRHVRAALSNLAQGESAITTLKAGMSGIVNIGTIITPSFTILPQAIARTKAGAPRLNINVTLSTSDELVNQLKHGQLDFLIARILDHEEGTTLLFDELSEESECAVVRPGHPFRFRRDLTLQELAEAGWILSPKGSVLRHRFEMMFRRNDLEPPVNVVETTAIPVIMGLLQQTDMLHVMPREVAEHYARAGELQILAIDLPCKMDSFGLILRRGHLLSPGAALLLKNIREVAIRPTCSPPISDASSAAPDRLQAVPA